MAAASSLFLISGGLSAFGSLMGGRAAQKSARFQARIAEQQAARERRLAELEERDFRREQSRVFGELRAAAGGSGIDPNTGSPVLGAADFAREVELQARRIREGGAVRSLRKKQEASLLRRAGSNAQLQGLFRAGASLLTGIGQSRAFG